jgi:uncharacterized SAM-binding protein YcdF (DUF218 family)
LDRSRSGTSRIVRRFAVTSSPIVPLPRADSPTRADAVVVLAGGRTERLGTALELVERDVSRTLVISDGRDPEWPAANRLCDGAKPRLTVVCFRPEPYSTWGEAEDVAVLARRWGWESLAVVTSTSHVFRARMLFERCVDGRVEVAAAGHKLIRLPLNLFWETGKLVAAVTFKRGC